jgi:hypothetical protein
MAACSTVPNNTTRKKEGQHMKFYDSVGPNPRIVRMFMAEKGIEMPKQTSICARAKTARPSI